MQFLLYCLCGGLGVLVDFSIYSIALEFSINYQIANAAGYFSGTLISFILNRKITFDAKDHVIRRLVLFMGVAGTGYLTSAFFLWALAGFFNLDLRLAKLVTLPVVIILQFSLNRWITFRR